MTLNILVLATDFLIGLIFGVAVSSRSKLALYAGIILVVVILIGAAFLYGSYTTAQAVAKAPVNTFLSFLGLGK